MFSAPGKLLLLGEYAVLRRGRALVAAVDRRAVGRWAETPEPPSVVVREVLARCPSARGGPEIDTRAFRAASGEKLGLGSSAAAAVLTAALGGAEDVLAVAIAGHRSAAGGRGSGVDVAACFFGGVLAAARQPGPIEHLPPGPLGASLGFFFTGHGVSTAPFVAAVEALPDVDRRLEMLSGLAEDGIAAWSAGDAASAIVLFADYGDGLAALGHAAGIPIVTEPIARAQAIARAAGGAAKPSGAGGGDVFLVLGEAAIAAVEAELGQRRLPLSIDPRGLER